MKTKIFLGIILVLLGLTVMLDNLNFGFWNVFGKFWPIVLVFWGMDRLREHGKSKFWSMFLVIFGIGAIFSNLDLIPVDFFELLWPMLLITMGIWLIIPAKRKLFHFTHDANDLDGMTTETLTQDSVNHVNIFSGFKTKVQTQNFLGGDVVTIFGSSEIDLRDTQINTSRVSLDLVALFGGITVFVPSNWKIIVEGASIFGSTNNQTQNTDPKDENKTIIIEGYPIFGGIKIMN